MTSDQQEREDTLLHLSVDVAHRRAHGEAAVAAVAAAAAVFARAAIAPMRARRESLRVRDWWESGGQDRWKPSARVFEGHHVWLEAEAVAVQTYRAVSGDLRADPVLLLDFEDKL